MAFGFPCCFTGRIEIDGQPAPAGTYVRPISESGNVLADPVETGKPGWNLPDDTYMMIVDSKDLSNGDPVNFEILLEGDWANEEDWDKKGIEYNINQDMYDAMVSMAFNMGRSGFRNSDFIQLVKKGKYEEAKDEIKKTSKRSFRKFPGLKDRREKEANLFASGLNKLNRT